MVVYHSIQPEGLPTVILEAMRLSAPIVAAAIGGATEIVQDGLSGRLVPPGDAAALADAVIELLRDRGRARQLGAGGRARLMAEFDRQSQALKTDQVYRHVLGLK